MGQLVQQRSCEAFCPECFSPFFERQIASDQGGNPLVALRDQLEEQFSSGFAQRHKPQLINDQQLDLGQLALQPWQALLISGLHQLMDQ